jgi:hypothetical protein
MTSQIIQFYSGNGYDHIGRSLDAILNFTDEQLENIHDFIQWLFPIETQSQVNPSAPVVCKDIQLQFRNTALLRANLCKACRRMLDFYGLHCHAKTAPSSRVTLDRNFHSKSGKWLMKHNHNHLRLTRILKSLRLLGLEVCSKNLFLCLKNIALRNPQSISTETLSYWQDSQKISIGLSQQGKGG